MDNTISSIGIIENQEEDVTKLVGQVVLRALITGHGDDLFKDYWSKEEIEGLKTEDGEEGFMDNWKGEPA